MVVVESGFAAGATGVSTTGVGVASIVVVVVEVLSVLAASPLPAPQEAKKRPIARVITLNFSIFINFCFLVVLLH